MKCSRHNTLQKAVVSILLFGSGQIGKTNLRQEALESNANSGSQNALLFWLNQSQVL